MRHKFQSRQSGAWESRYSIKKKNGKGVVATGARSEAAPLAVLPELALFSSTALQVGIVLFL